MLTDDNKERVRRTIEQAFLPLRCVAKFDDYDKVISFKIFGPDGGVVQKLEDINAENANSKGYLDSVLASVRLILRNKGFYQNGNAS